MALTAKSLFRNLNAKLDTWLWHHFWAKFICVLHDPYEELVMPKEDVKNADVS